MKEIPVIVLSDDDSDAPVIIKRRRLVKNRTTVKKNYVQETNDGNTIGFNNNQKKELCSVSKSTTKNLIDEATDEEFNEYENFNADFVSLFDEEANEAANSKAETLTKATTEFASWDELADQTGIDLNDLDIYSVRFVSDGDEADNGIHKNTNKRKANAIPDMIPSNAKLLVDLSIRHAGRPVTRQPMTQDMLNEILNSKKPAIRPPRQVNNTENNLQKDADAIQPSKKTRGRPRISELPTCNAGQSIDSTPRGRGRHEIEISKGATTSKQDTLYRGNSTLVGSDMHNLKGKMVTRQSLRKMNSTQPQRKGVKNAQRHGFVGISKDYLDHGDPTFPCESCGALLWHAETLRRATDALDQSYSICCSRGKVKLGTELKEPPKLLKDLITNEHNKSAAFIDNIRRYNSMFAFTSMGGKVDDTVNYGRGPFCYRIHGENYHRVGSLLPGTDKTPKFAQLYIFDTENEITNRIKAVRLIGTRNPEMDDNKSTTDREVAPLIVGDFDSTKNKRDIILLQQDGDLKRISELHPQYLAMQYPLFSLYAEDGYQRENEFSMMLNGRRLFKQFLVDWYTMIEAERMSFNRKQQKDLRSETYSKLAKLTEDPESGVQLRAVYTIEFQKRGLPHCHILLWLEPEDKITTTAKIDKYISAEIPNKNEDPELYQIVTDHMMHGPCGADNPSCPCTVDFKCTKKFPKQFNETTVIDDKGYAIYKRRNDGNTITKSETDLHNGYVVPYNTGLLRRYQLHINVE
ncbi:putative PIF1 DNA helicase/replication protein A1-like protein [Tanacetum coccineum]